MSTINTHNTPEEWMRLALIEAAKALYLSDPNPRVGCILVNAQNEMIGKGFTQAAGSSHAEVMALKDAQANNQPTQGATAYVTLEPCSHQGRTPPCSQALIAAGIKKVVIAATDPNPLVAGKGIKQLEEAGITVETGLLANESIELNIGFFQRMTVQKPWVRLKMATSLDGKTALLNGQSQWITTEVARNDGQRWRARASTVLTGIGTLLSDDPQLNVRSISTPRQPWHAIIDSSLQTPISAKILQRSSGTPVLIYTASTDVAKKEALEAAGATVIQQSSDEQGHLNLAVILSDLAKRECNELHIEAGSHLSSAFLKQNLVDEILLYMAPRLLGDGMPFVQGLNFTSLEETLNFQFHQVDHVGCDLRILLRRQS